MFSLPVSKNKHKIFLGLALTATHLRHFEDLVLIAVIHLFQELPDSLKEQTHLEEWHINNTLIRIIPTYIELFEAMRILDLQKNQISHLPAEIGMSLSRSLRGSGLEGG